jgi:hypothetical protein
MFSLQVHENSVLVWKGGNGPQMIDLTIKHKDGNSEPSGSSKKNQRYVDPHVTYET